MNKVPDPAKMVKLITAKEVYLRAMSAWCKNPDPTPARVVVEGDKTTVEFWYDSGGGYRAVDKYCQTVGSDRREGSVAVSCDGVDVWALFYNSTYSPSVISFVREALYQTCDQGVFYGGRGPKGHTGHLYGYRNTTLLVSFTGTFGGEEEVYLLSSSDTIGRCTYYWLTV